MKQMTLRALLVIAVLALILSGCGGAATPAPSPTQAPAATKAPEPTKAPEAKPTKLLIWATGDETFTKILQAAGDYYTSQHPNVTIEVQTVSWNDAHAKILAAATGGQGPDVITGGMSWGIEFGKLGGMIDLRKAYPDTVSAIEKVTIPQAFKAISTKDGEVYGVQYSVDLMAMLYRTDLLKEIAGMDKAPATWEELATAVEKFNAAGKKGFAMQWGNTQWLQFFNWLYSAGGSLYDDACTKATVASPEGLKALQFYTDMYKKWNAPTDGWPDIETGLETGDYPLSITGSWDIGSLDTTKPAIAGKWAPAPLPKGPGGKGVSFLGGQIIGIMAYSKNADAAAQFIASLYTPESMDVRAAKAAELNSLYIPPGVGLISRIKTSPDRIAVLQAILKDAQGPPPCLGWEEASKTLEQKIQEVYLGTGDAQKALEAGAAAMDAALKQ